MEVSILTAWLSITVLLSSYNLSAGSPILCIPLLSQQYTLLHLGFDIPMVKSLRVWAEFWARRILQEIERIRVVVIMRIFGRKFASLKQDRSNYGKSSQPQQP